MDRVRARAGARSNPIESLSILPCRTVERLVLSAILLQIACAPKQVQTVPAAPAIAPSPSSIARILAEPATQAARPDSSSGRASVVSGTDVVLLQVANPTSEARAAETIALPLVEIGKYWLTPKQVVVFDAFGNSLLSQLADMDGDELPDELLFQTDLAAGESKRFSLRFGTRTPPPPDAYRVYGRFVRERHDDFAWENDRIARRVYGPGLQIWSREPLTSSGIDAWVKRTKRLVINDWYLTDDYHHDRGQGADLYSVGQSRGCGGLGIWANDALHVSRNFTRSRVLANGPLRLIFELDYAPWTAGSVRVAETKRITLDAGKNFERHVSAFQSSAPRSDVAVGLGIAKHKGSDVHVDAAGSWMRVWEPMAEDSHFGCGIVLPNGSTGTPKQTKTDYLLVSTASPSGQLVYYAGFGWDRSGDFADAAAWTRNVQAFAREVAAPATVTFSLGTGAMPWSARACESMMTRDPRALTSQWHYDSGFVLTGCLNAAKKHGNPKHAEFVKRAVDSLIAPDGSIAGYKLEEYNIDSINMGKVLYPLYEEAKDPAERQRYEKVLRLLRSQMKTQPRTQEGGYWHKQIYPSQMWLDGAFMASPFLAKYALVFEEPKLFDEIANELVLLERHTRDANTGLLYHGWDESKQQRWASKDTGTSPHFWGRAMGWYAMALVDVLELTPQNHPKRGVLVAILNRLAKAVASVQDPQTGVWWQVLDAAKRDRNYLESSASAMFAYALTKGVKNRWIDPKRYGPVADRAYRGTLEQFVEVDGGGRLDLKQVCKVAGLGGTPYRDGSYEYYTSTEVVANDPKGVGAFIFASLERE